MTARRDEVKRRTRASRTAFRYEARVWPTLDWKLLVTARSGRRSDLVYALRPIVKLQRAGFPDVSIGRVADDNP